MHAGPFRFPVFPLMSVSSRFSGRARFALSLSLFAFGAVACSEGQADPTGPTTGTPEAAINQVVTFGPLNASSTDTLVYFSFAIGGLVARSGDWDLAFRRYELRLNSPAIGGATSKNVLGYALDNNKAATDAQVLAFTPANTLAPFDSLRAARVPADTLFQTDRLAVNPQAHLNLGGFPTANAANYWKVRRADGGYAVVRTTAISFTQQRAVQSITFEIRAQVGATLGAPQTLVLTPAGQTTSFSLSTASVVASPAGCNWDLRFDPNPTVLGVEVNSGCSAGTYPGPASPTFANATVANDAPQYASYLSQLVGPIPNSVVDKSAPFRYNLTGTDRLHPAFNTYLVKSGTKVFKVQVTDYYSNTGAPGFPTIRYARIR